MFYSDALIRVIKLTLLTSCLISCTVQKQILTTHLQTQEDDNIFAFVGEKITVNDIGPQYITVTETVIKDGVEYQVERQVINSMDEKMVATYKVVQPLKGDLRTDRIEFSAYDHWGSFTFADYDHALLLVGKFKGEYFLHKYQHDVVFQTQDEHWALCGESPIDGSLHVQPAIKSQPINFYPEVRFGPSDTPPSAVDTHDKDALKDYWNSSLFEIRGDQAICKKGIYVKDLLDLRINTVMKARLSND